MTHAEILSKLTSHSILPTPQRVDVATVLFAEPQHLSAEVILERLQSNERRVSKATVYNTLKLFADKGLVGRRLVDAERVLYDSLAEPHHHVFNIDTGELHDIPHESIRIDSLPDLPEETWSGPSPPWKSSPPFSLTSERLK